MEQDALSHTDLLDVTTSTGVGVLSRRGTCILELYIF